MLCIVFILFLMYVSVHFLKQLPYGVTLRRRFGGRRGDSGIEKSKVSGMGWPGSILVKFPDDLHFFIFVVFLFVGSRLQTSILKVQNVVLGAKNQNLCKICDVFEGV